MHFHKKTFTNNASVLIAAICVIVGAIYRIAFSIIYSVQSRDSYDYVHFIRQWEDSNVIPFNASFPPLGLFILKIPYHFFSYDIIKGGIVINMVLGLLIILLLIQIAKETLKSISAMFLLGIIGATNTSLIKYSCQFLRENTYLFFLCLTVLCLIRFYKSNRAVEIIYISLCTVCSALCRREGIELVIFFVLLLLFFLFRKKISFRKALSFSLLYFISFAAFLLSISIICDVPLNYYMALVYI